MNPPLPSIENLLALLNANSVRYLIVGGVAVGLNGFTRMTEDLDLILQATSENISKTANALSQFGEGFGNNLTLEDFLNDTAGNPDCEGAIRILEEEIPLDLFIQMRGIRYEAMLPKSHRVFFSGISSLTIGPETLLQLKKDSHREKDQIDVASLSKTKVPYRVQVSVPMEDPIRLNQVRNQLQSLWGSIQVEPGSKLKLEIDPWLYSSEELEIAKKTLAREVHAILEKD